MQALAPRLVILAALGLAGLALAPSCGNPDGTTPTCTPDVDANGNKHLPDGCNPFPKCDKGPASECCKGLTGSDLANCLYGFGEGTVSSSSSGAGGKGSGGSGGKGTGGKGSGGKGTGGKGTGGSGGKGGAGGH